MNNGIRPKLVRFREKNNKKIIFISVSLFFLFLLGGIYLYSSFAAFTEEKQFNVINGTVQDPGDIYFAYYVDGEITRSIPTEGSGYTLDTEKSNCTNGVSISFDDYNYAVITSYKNYNATDYTRTRCDLYFKKLDMQLTDYIKKLALYDNPNLIYDGTTDNNLRYIGSNPNNYVSIDGELWRIIGVMNNILDGTGKKEARIKLIRDESIGSFSWDSSESSINNGLGVNEWSEADIMKLLNPGYDNESVGGSLYWNSKSGKCYNFEYNATTSCDFTHIGIKSTLKSLIKDAIWNTGAIATDDQIVSDFYTEERGTKNGKMCTSGIYCNDSVTRTTTWTGKIGLMYPSDYGYATSGISSVNRTKCLNVSLHNLSSYIDCYNNSWLYNSSAWQWTMSPFIGAVSAGTIIYLSQSGETSYDNGRSTGIVIPVVYLLPSVKVISGIGSKESPFILGL